jgi:hypothetical protein
VLPFFELDLVRSWYGPIGDHIRRESGLELRLAWKPTFADFLRAASRHDFDLVIAPTYTAPILSREFGLVPLGKTGVRPQTVLFVRRESTTSDIQQLRGRRIATPHRLATVSVLARHRLALEGLREGESVEFVDLESHSDVAMHVLEGRSAAGVAMSLALERLSPVLRSAIRELGRVGEYLDWLRPSWGMPGRQHFEAPSSPLDEPPIRPRCWTIPSTHPSSFWAQVSWSAFRAPTRSRTGS